MVKADKIVFCTLGKEYEKAQDAVKHLADAGVKLAIVIGWPYAEEFTPPDELKLEFSNRKIEILPITSKLPRGYMGDHLIW